MRTQRTRVLHVTLIHWRGRALHRYYWDWSGLLQTLDAAGIRMLTYINPNLANNVAQLKPNARTFVAPCLVPWTTQP